MYPHMVFGIADVVRLEFWQMIAMSVIFIIATDKEDYYGTHTQSEIVI